MRTVMRVLLGATLGLAGGAAAGFGAGLAWINAFETTDFEGYAATLVFFTFVPFGGLIGALTGIAWAGIMALRSRIYVTPD